MAKSVCIIGTTPLLLFLPTKLMKPGAGPSGLTAAKTLSHDAPKDSFHVTVFEASNRIGGLWPLAKIDDGLVNPDMCVNQSRHTVSFSDFAWGEGKASFPKAWEVGEYLEAYRNRYGVSVKLGSRVLGTEKVGERWKVRVGEEKGEKVWMSEHCEFGGKGSDLGIDVRLRSLDYSYRLLWQTKDS